MGGGARLRAVLRAQVGPFDVADKFFKEINTPLDNRLRHYFVDSGMTPLMVQVPTAPPGSPSCAGPAHLTRGRLPQDAYLQANCPPPQGIPAVRQQLWSLGRVVAASESIANADVVGARIARDQTWGLAPLHGVLGCVAPGSYTRGNVGRVQFPSWLGKNSTRGKRFRMLRECTAHMQAHISGSQEDVRQAYVPALRGPLLKPLRERGADGIEEARQRSHVEGIPHRASRPATRAPTRRCAGPRR